MSEATIIVDGKKIKAPAGALLIDICKRVGVQIPSFCYYPGLSLQGACRMCLVQIEKMAKLQTACTTPIVDGMVVTSESETIAQARKAMLEFVLQNHPLDCPVCDAGGQCELQDATLSYGASESKLIDFKNHRDEQQWSPVVYFDRPRCIMCYRCVRVCGEGMDVWALGVSGRNSSQLIVPNKEDHLECEECGMCIDICPVGALTSGAYRYKTRPWEMKHVATICTHCSDGCTTTLGTRPSEGGVRIIRGSNRSKAGLNEDFLCIKGRYAFDFTEHPQRLKAPLIRKDGRLSPSSWSDALSVVAAHLQTIRDSAGGRAIGVIGSTRTTNEENFLLQKVARVVFQTNNIDHHRSADFPAFFSALKGNSDLTASMKDVKDAPAILLIGNDPTYQHPLLAWQIRTAVRLHGCRLYVINARSIKLSRQATDFVQVPQGAESRTVAFLAGHDLADDITVQDHILKQLTELRSKLRQEKDLIIIFGSEVQDTSIGQLVQFGSRIPRCRFICLCDYANSRGAADMGLYPHFLPGYVPVSSVADFEKAWGASLAHEPGLNLPAMFKAAQKGDLNALYVVGANPVARYQIESSVLKDTFLVVQDLFLTETASLANVVLPAACAYEKSGTFTNTCGDLQRVTKAGDVAGTRTDLEIIARLAQLMGYDLRELMRAGEWLRGDMGQSRGAQSGEADRHAVWLQRQKLEPRSGIFNPEVVFDEIQRLVPSYNLGPLNVIEGKKVNMFAADDLGDENRENLIKPSYDNLFSSGTLGRYSDTLNAVMERDLLLPNEEETRPTNTSS
jgi:NADH-quinone oxidoreductase subunit G